MTREKYESLPLATLKELAKARKMKKQDLEKLIHDMTEEPFLGFLGEERINVLALNMELDRRAAEQKQQKSVSSKGGKRR